MSTIKKIEQSSFSSVCRKFVCIITYALWVNHKKKNKKQKKKTYYAWTIQPGLTTKIIKLSKIVLFQKR